MKTQNFFLKNYYKKLFSITVLKNNNQTDPIFLILKKKNNFLPFFFVLNNKKNILKKRLPNEFAPFTWLDSLYLLLGSSNKSYFNNDPNPINILSWLVVHGGLHPTFSSLLASILEKPTPHSLLIFYVYMLMKRHA